jgi:hypothetical protein
VVVRLVIAVVILGGVGALAWRMRVRRPDAPPRDVFPVPRQLDRDDFVRPDAPFLVALFSSTTCESCQGLPEKLAVLESADVATCEIELGAAGALHQRYQISAIPMLVVADADGVVRRAFVGAVTATDLWAAVAEVRAPGSTPEPAIGELESDGARLRGTGP